jgi:co-chaperonin GroES (HSP10)
MTMTEPAVAAHVTNAEGEVAQGDYPIPAGWRILVEPIKVEEKTAGGIHLPTSAVEAKEHLRYIGRVVAMGPLCYQHKKFADADGSALKWCVEGDYIAYGAYAGQEIKVRNKKGDAYVSLRLLNDDEVLAVIPSPDSVLIYC